MSHKEIPKEVDIDLAECALNNPVLMHNLLSTFLTHSEIVEDDKGLCGIPLLRKSFQMLLFCQHIRLIF